MERRAFLQWVGVGSLASCLPVAIAACIREPEVPAAPAPTGPFESIGTTTQLEQSGQLNVKIGDAQVIVLRDPDSSNLVAVNSTCTHQGCEVTWQASQSAFVCPCHEAKFRATGAVIEGPADRPLATYPIKTDGNSILMQKS